MRPLLICDCDEVLLHMVRHFGVWLRESHDIDFTPNGGDFATSMKRRDGGAPPSREEMWGLLEQFFPAEMERQTLVPHAREALAALGETADIVILTNLGDANRQPRIAQLLGHGMDYRVETNQGGKGDPVARLVAEHGNPITVFVDDLAVHHDSVSRHAPGVHRLHMISEPTLALHVPKAPEAHVRIDDWHEAEAWIAARFAAGLPATT
ncbi:HAD family hydrolase [Sphingomonas sp. AR_OL41]|uniref:HAD family hydrolase n=1 Tax=Sphingomonas sp. AR_OL41 TaxID=3042729 RepID=UPI002480C506|nr:HAD family hydrolase [Sphingomonas sp. AR_OL41]MDH7975881.1 HAD family hydrolase [Sphingomonas sp. AR_OL41]